MSYAKAGIIRVMGVTYQIQKYNKSKLEQWGVEARVRTMNSLILAYSLLQ